MKKLVVTLPSDTEIQMTREFDAPRDLVWEVFTKPEHVKQWWGATRLSMIVCEIDLRVGGEYRFVGKRPDGMEVPFKGVHQEIVPPERIVYTEIFDVPPFNESPSLVTTTFTEKDGKTTMTCIARYDSKQTRDYVLSTGMADGAGESYDRAEELMRKRMSR